VTGLKITVITVCYNAADTLERSIQSVINQNYSNVEYIIIDGASTDGTLDIIEKYKDQAAFVESKSDGGIYDAMNKGIARATGDIIGMLNADDFYTASNVLTEIAKAFEQNNVDAIYADLNYINRDGKVVRKWRAGKYKYGAFNYGWMPPHPTFYCTRNMYNKLGVYSLEYGTAADYELMLRFIHVQTINVFYLEEIILHMTVGGASNRSIINRLRSMRYDFKAMYCNKISNPLFTLLLKPVSKLKQFFN
jgi:glycosyltransferase involved in cell wall biosynthesis